MELINSNTRKLSNRNEIILNKTMDRAVDDETLYNWYS